MYSKTFFFKLNKTETESNEKKEVSGEFYESQKNKFKTTTSRVKVTGSDKSK